MITCPNCGAENADNANHCGNCGTKIHTSGAAKTMFGFAAISPEDMKKAAEEAQGAGEPAKLKLPTPTLPSPSSLPSPNLPSALQPPSSAGKFNIPAPSSLSTPDTAGSDFGGSDVPTQMTPAVSTPLPTPQPAFAPEPSSDFAFNETQPPSVLAEAGAKLQEELSLGGQHTTQEERAIEPSLPVAAPAAPLSTGGGFGGTGFGGGGSGGGGGGGGFGGKRGEVRNPITTTILIFVTCGFYGMYLWYLMMNEINDGFGEERYNVVKELVLSILCFVYGIYLLWRLCNDIEELQKRWGVEPQFTGVIMFAMNFFYIGPWAMQSGLNNAWENGSPR